MKTNEQLAHTLNWLVEQDLIPGLLPESVTAAAERLIWQGKRIAELEAILAANKHTASVEIADGPSPYSKEVRLRVDIVDPRAYSARHLMQEYELTGATDDYLHHVALHSLRMATRSFEEELLPQAMRAMHKAVQEMKSNATS